MFENISKKRELGLKSYDIKDSNEYHNPILYPVLFVKDGPVYNTSAEMPLENLNLQLDSIFYNEENKKYNLQLKINPNKLSNDSKDDIIVNYFIELTEEILLYIKSSCILNFTTAIEYSKFTQVGFGHIFNVPKRFHKLLEDNTIMLRVYIKKFAAKLLTISTSKEYIDDLKNYEANISIQIAQMIYRLMIQAIEEEINEIYVVCGLDDYTKNKIYDSFDELNIHFEEGNDIANILTIKNLLIGLPLTMYENFLVPMCNSILVYMATTGLNINKY